MENLVFAVRDSRSQIKKISRLFAVRDSRGKKKKSGHFAVRDFVIFNLIITLITTRVKIVTNLQLSFGIMHSKIKIVKKNKLVRNILLGTLTY